jgi:hypothetical protein
MLCFKVFTPVAENIADAGLSSFIAIRSWLAANRELMR